MSRGLGYVDWFAALHRVASVLIRLSMQSTRYAILTGIGLATPQGADAPTTWRNLLAGQVLHERIGRVPVESDDTAPRVSQLAIRVAQEAVAMAGRRWGIDAFADPRTAIVVGTSKGPIEEWIALNEALRRGGLTAIQASESDTQAPRRCVSPITGLDVIAADLARALKHGYGPRLTLAAACASGLHALIRAQALIETGQCDRVLVVAAESSTSALFEAAYQRMGVLADLQIGCRPFDQHRQGFVMSEAAAAVCVEASDRPTGLRLAAGVMLSDATHITGTDPTGRSFREALRAVQPDEEPIDLVHAHGTGTSLNDPIELGAIEVLCGDPSTRPAVYSHKHAIGHTQGAAGLISVAINYLAHQYGVVPPNANTPNPIASPANVVTISNQPIRRPIQASLAIAAGFGSPVAAISLINTHS